MLNSIAFLPKCYRIQYYMKVQGLSWGFVKGVSGAYKQAEYCPHSIGI